MLEFISDNIIFIILGILVLLMIIAVTVKPKKEKEVEEPKKIVNENEPFFLNPDRPLVEPTPEPEPEPEPEPKPLSPEEEAKAIWAIEEKPEVSEQSFGG